MPNPWDDLDQQVEAFFQEGHPAEATQAAEKALAMVERALGPVHPTLKSPST